MGDILPEGGGRRLLLQRPGSWLAVSTAETAWSTGHSAVSATEDIYKIYAESFRGTDHLHRVLAEAQTIVGAALAAQQTEIASVKELKEAP